MTRSVMLIAFLARLAPAQDPLPLEWTDRDTGHRVVRLSREDGTQSLYFHQNAYSAEGRSSSSPRAAGSRPSTLRLATQAADPRTASASWSPAARRGRLLREGEP